jgi:Fe-S-cluster containining protein
MTDFVQIYRESKIRDTDFFPMANEMYEQIWNRLMPPQLLTENLSAKIANNIVTPVDAPVPDCMTCGACCALMPCVGVPPRLKLDSDLYWDIVKETEAGEIVVDRYLRRNGETLICSALDITETSVACSIYESRPQMCRDFEAGSDRCHALRRAVGLEPFLSLTEMPAAIEKLESRPVQNGSKNMIRNVEIKFDAESGLQTITALMRDGTLRQIHDYDPKSETYFQFEFDGLSIDAAERLICSRNTPKNESA